MRVATIVFLAAMIAGCSDGMAVAVEFASDRGLKAGDPVYLGDVRVGEVHGVDRRGSGARVELRLQPKLVAELRGSAAAMATVRDERQVVELLNPTHGSPVQSGDQLPGLDSALEYAVWQAGSWMDQSQQTLGTAVGELETYFNSQQWRQHKDQMRRGVESLDASAREALDQAYEELDLLLDELNRQAERAQGQAHEHYQLWARRIMEQLQRLGEYGSDSMAQLEELLQQLNRALESDQTQRQI